LLLRFSTLDLISLALLLLGPPVLRLRSRAFLRLSLPVLRLASLGLLWPILKLASFVLLRLALPILDLICLACCGWAADLGADAPGFVVAELADPEVDVPGLAAAEPGDPGLMSLALLRLGWPILRLARLALLRLNRPILRWRPWFVGVEPADSVAAVGVFDLVLFPVFPSCQPRSSRRALQEEPLQARHATNVILSCSCESAPFWRS